MVAMYKGKWNMVIYIIMILVLSSSCNLKKSYTEEEIDDLIQKCDDFYYGGNLDSALYYNDKVLSQTEDKHYALYQKGLIMLDLENPSIANTVLSKAVDLAPDSLTYLEFYGISFALMGEYEESISQFTRMIQKDSLLARAYFNRGFSKQRLELWSSSIEDYNMTEKLDSNFMNMYFQRASSYLILENYEKFCEDINKALSMGDERVTSDLLEMCNEIE